MNRRGREKLLILLKARKTQSIFKHYIKELKTEDGKIK